MIAAFGHSVITAYVDGGARGACALIRGIGDVSFEHIRREFNKDAHRLSNLGMDEAEQGVNAKPRA